MREKFKLEFPWMPSFLHMKHVNKHGMQGINLRHTLSFSITNLGFLSLWKPIGNPKVG